MRFGSVCSGIEAASIAWNPIGWKAAWLAEIEPFPCAVLAHHYPDVPNLGDMTTIANRVLNGEVEAPDVFTGGTPCQAFSVAGLRESLADDRGNLTLKFVELADAIDYVRDRRGSQPSIIIWENVPGVLSTKDNAFGCFLSGLAGESVPIVPPRDKWSNAGCVYGPKRAIAWRVLDAQYFGVAQRRRRVFVVASAREGFDPSEVLFEFQGLRRDFAPGREEGEEVAGTIAARFGISRNNHEECVVASGKSTIGTLMANAGTKLWLGNQEALTGDYHILTPIALAENTIGRQPHNGGNGDGFTVGGPMYTLNATGVHGVVQPIAYSFDSLASNSMKSNNPHSGCRQVEISNTLDTTTPEPSKNQGGIAVMQTIAFPANLSGTQCASSENIAPSMGAKNPTAVMHSIAPTLTSSNDPSRSPQSTEVTNQVAAVHAASMAVRRLTPIECERLQGFPDNYTNIPWRKQPESPDGPRYKALGNSWAVPVARWIGERVDAALKGANHGW